jgi:hypothetical protein
VEVQERTPLTSLQVAVISAASIRDPPIDVYEETGSQTMTVRNQRACSWRCSSRTDGDRENRWTNATERLLRLSDACCWRSFRQAAWTNGSQRAMPCRDTRSEPVRRLPTLTGNSSTFARAVSPRDRSASENLTREGGGEREVASHHGVTVPRRRALGERTASAVARQTDEKRPCCRDVRYQCKQQRRH